MRLNTRYTFLLWALLVPVITLWADDYPTVNPVVTFTNSEGETSTDLAYTGSAPVKASCVANPENTTGWDGYYEWRIYHDTEETPYIIRYEQDTELEFTQSGTHRIVLYAKFTKDGEVQEFLTDDSPVTVTISESQLQMPNAFSPNGDGINDIYKAKSGYQSLIEFHGYIFNRWGQKIYEWHDPAGGWDGKFNGKDVKQGVYFVLVKAKGADGRKYNIKKDVNLLRGYTESNGVNPTE